MQEVEIEGLGKVLLGNEFETPQETIGMAELFESLKSMLSDQKLEHNLFFEKIKSGDPGSLLVFLFSVILGLVIAYQVISRFFPEEVPLPVREEEERDPPRDFTLEQLREFDGTQEDKKIYIALVGEVYDVSKAAEFYGPNACYHCFAGRDASRAMARYSFEEADLANNNVDDLGPFEKSTLQDWIDKFKHYKCYPIVGRLSVPIQLGEMTLEDLKKHKESLSSSSPSPLTPPEGRVNTPLLLALKGNILDVSYGGYEMYKEGGPYHCLVGIDASRALGMMSFNPQDLASSSLSDLSPQQLKTLEDWEEKLVQKRKYPVVGQLKL